MLSPSTVLRTCLSKHGAGFFSDLLGIGPVLLVLLASAAPLYKHAVHPSNRTSLKGES